MEDLLYGITFGEVYFVGLGEPGFSEDSPPEASITLRNARVRRLRDRSVGIREDGVFVLSEEHLRRLFEYLPKTDAIPSISLPRQAIDKIVAFPYLLTR